MKELNVAAAIIERDGRYLIGRRKEGHLEDKWEFPGGKIEPGETPRECLRRELKEELGIEVLVRYFMVEGSYQDGDLRIRLLGYRTDYLSGEFKLKAHKEIKWVYPHEMSSYDFAPADVGIVKRLKKADF